jgi:uncharacterized protein YukE
MSVEEIYMDVPAVRDIGKQLNQISEVLKLVLKALDGIVNLLKTAAFLGLVSASVATQFERTRSSIEKSAEQCADLSAKVERAASNYERGDLIAANRFD